MRNEPKQGLGIESEKMSYNAITELRGVKRIVGGGIRKEREARRNSERGGGQAEGGGMFANKPGSPPKVFSVGFNRGPRKVPQRGVPAESIFIGVKVRTLCGVQWRRRLAAQAAEHDVYNFAIHNQGKEEGCSP